MCVYACMRTHVCDTEHAVYLALYMRNGHSMHVHFVRVCVYACMCTHVCDSEHAVYITRLYT
jgi:hypothetical protein